MNAPGRLPLDHRGALSSAVVTFFDGRGHGLDIRAAPRETDLKTVVRKLREDSELFSQTLDALPNPNRADASQPRKKRWTARVKTGCVTCRSRRIKCDETKPACKRCSLTGRTCTYDAASSSSPETTASSCSSSSPESPPPPPVKGLPSPDWHLTESLQYYITVMLPMHGFHATGDSAYTSSYQAKTILRNDGFDAASFVMQILSHRVQCMSSAHHLPNVYGALPAIKPVWERLFHQMAIAVSNLNRSMALESNMYFVLHRVVDLMHTELTLSIPTWRAHAEGFGALVKTYGGIPALFRLPKPPAMSAQLALIASAMCNSTSPADQQIKLMSNWSDEDIATAYSHTGFHAFPCPTVLLQAISRITHLRTLVAGCTNVAAVKELVPWAREAFAKVQHFDPTGWIEPYATDHDFYPVVGRAFQYAVALYGILSLPDPLAAVFTYPPEAAAPHKVLPVDDNDDLIYEMTQKYPTPQIRYREHLFTLFRRALPAAPSVEGLLWHAAVLGVAYSNHEDQEHRIILDYVASLRFVYGADGGAIHLHDRLREFWASGKREWDQCFYEPTNILT